MVQLFKLHLNSSNVCNNGFLLGNAFTVITSVLLVVDHPNEDLYEKVKFYFGKKRSRRKNAQEFFDMDILNKEFACKDEVNIKKY